MEKYILTMKNAEQQGKQIADRVQRFARDLYEIDTGTIFSVDYRVMRKRNLLRLLLPPLSPCARPLLTPFRAQRTKRRTSSNILI